MIDIERVLINNQLAFHPLVEFDPRTEKLHPFNFTAYSDELGEADIANTEKFSIYISNQLAETGAKYGIGGYNENRVLYRRSNIFDTSPGKNGQAILEVPAAPDTLARSVHLGIDIWGSAGTAVFAPLAGKVHSVAFNDQFGDYGATIILQHQLDNTVFHTLYGHVSLGDITHLKKDTPINKGDEIAHFGLPAENGWWPPHLHFQVIIEMDGREGDYPGVCAPVERDHFLHNCPDPNLVLNLLQYVRL